MSTRIEPTVGRIVWFTPGASDIGHAPLAAIIANVCSSNMVNLAVFGSDGSVHSRCGAILVQDGDPIPAGGHYCEWMPYQKGQAAKTEALEAKLGAVEVVQDPKQPSVFHANPVQDSEPAAALQQSSSGITAGAEKPTQVVDFGAAGPTRTGDLLITNQGAETAETLGNQQDTPSAAPVDGAQAAQGESSTCEGVTAVHGTRIEVSDLKHQSQRMAELRAEAAKWERLHDELYAEIASEHRRDEYGETETAAECVRRIIRERDELRAQLDEYEREKLKRESQEPVAFRWLGPGKGWRAVYAEPPVSLALREPTEDECSRIYAIADRNPITRGPEIGEMPVRAGRAMWQAVREVMTK